MQSAETQAALRQVAVDGVDAERQRGAEGFRGAPSFRPGPLQCGEYPTQGNNSLILLIIVCHVASGEGT
jgi:hypothetical protein